MRSARGQGTVEYLAVVLLVALVLGGGTAAAARARDAAQREPPAAAVDAHMRALDRLDAGGGSLRQRDDVRPVRASLDDERAAVAHAKDGDANAP